MKTITYKGHTLEMYDSIQDLPIWRFQEYNKFTVVASGIGSDLEDIDSGMSALRGRIKTEPSEAIKQTVNIQQALHFIMGNISPKMSAFCVLVYKMDGVLITDDDLTDTGINRMIKRLSKTRLSMALLSTFLTSFKKKVEREFEQFFPGIANNGKTKDFYAKLRQRTVLVLQGVQGRNTAADVAKIDKDLLSKSKPKEFHGPNGIEVQMTKEFEATLVILQQQHASSQPRKLTTLAYYQALEVVKDQNKQKLKAANG